MVQHRHNAKVKELTHLIWFKMQKIQTLLFNDMCSEKVNGKVWENFYSILSCKENPWECWNNRQVNERKKGKTIIPIGIILLLFKMVNEAKLLSLN